MSHIFLLIGYLFWVWLCIVWVGWLVIGGGVSVCGEFCVVCVSGV